MVKQVVIHKLVLPLEGTGNRWKAKEIEIEFEKIEMLIENEMLIEKSRC